MNIRFKTQHSGFTCGKKFYAPATDDTQASVDEQRSNAKRTRKSQIANRKSKEGIALVITLILLSVTLVMAIAFLAISNRERNSVTTVMDTKVSQDAAEAARDQAEARIISQIIATQNPYISSLLVSTDYVNIAGFTNSGENPNGVGNLANVNFDYYAAPQSGPLSQGDFLQNVANLFYSPRVPVFVPVNGSNDFRYYLDLNRNGKYDTNGVVTNLDNNLNGLGSTSVQVGDPEWIGILEHPDQPHSANNPFIARFCFIAVPANSLDLNYIHNQAFDVSPAYDSVGGGVNPNTTSRDAYYRNQGVGTWEINLAAFLTDLNTNRWDPQTFWNSLLEPYNYPEGSMNSSVAFDDARALVSWRYNGNYNSLSNADSMVGGVGSLGDLAFRNNGIDYYSVAPVQTVFDTNYVGYDNPGLPWAGAQNANQFFSSPADLFDTNKTSAQFATNLVSAGTYNSTYDRYTFYRMLSQLGTDSQAESDKINLNYSNTLVNYDVNGLPVSVTVIPGSETNFVSWQPLNFFTAAADKMLHAYSAEWYESSPSNYMQSYYGLTNVPYYTNLDGVGITNIQYPGQTNQIPSFGITNIPVYINGQFVYTPAVNRILQLAANIFDAASTNNVNPAISGPASYPSVFRPILWKTNELNAFGVLQTNIYIKGFQYVTEPVQIVDGGNVIFNRPTELTDPTVPNGIMGITNNFYGVPWIIGAKKGFPNFNAFELDNTFFIERFLQFNRNTITASGSTYPFGRTYTTNQMYFIGISNVFAVEHWNSYYSNYVNPVTVVAQDVLSVGLTNDANYNIVNTAITNGYYATTAPVPWTAGQFIMPLGSNVYIPQNLAPVNTAPATNNLYVYFDGSAYGATNISGNQYNSPCFIPVTAVQPVPSSPSSPGNYINSGTPALPQFGLSTTNRLQAYILDTRDPNNVYILDYVQLGGMDNTLNLNQAIADNDDSGYWSTNIVSGDTPYGVYAQYGASYWGGNVPGPDNDGPTWQATSIPGVGQNVGQAGQQAYFTAFFQQNNTAEGVTNNLYSTQAPAMAMRKIVEKFAYQANDPLVHYVTSDLNDGSDTTTNHVNLSLPSTNALQYLGRASDRYMPWGQSGNISKVAYNGVTPDQNAYNLSYKDPLVWTSDNWDFPTNKFPNVGWLGRVHRGTPWQTVYLKSSNLMTLSLVIPDGATANSGQPTWQVWTGNPNADDAYNAAPIQDRLLFDLFTTAPNENATRGQLSVNVGADDPNNPLAGLAAWSALLSGTTIFSNSLPHQTVQYYYGHESPLYNQRQITYTNFINQPLGVPPYPASALSPQGDITNSPMWQIVQSINNARTNYVGIDGLHGVFEHVGDILSANALSDASPYLNQLYNGGVDPNQQDYGISDEMYEWMPQQIMSLLSDSGTPQSPPRYVIYCYGQSLKPAPNGVVNSAGTYFGLVTNYQVTAESAYRAVIRVENSPTPANPNAAPHIVIEQFNPLPPD